MPRPSAPALLAEASMTLSRSLDLETTVAEVGRLLVPRFADWCSLQLLRDGQLETVAVQHRDPETTEWARTLHRRLPDPHGRPHRAPNVVRTGRSEIYPFIPAELVEATAVSAEHLAILRRLGFTSAMVAPLTGRAGVVGAVTLIHAESGRRYSDEDVAFLEEVADRVAARARHGRDLRAAVRAAGRGHPGRGGRPARDPGAAARADRAGRAVGPLPVRGGRGAGRRRPLRGRPRPACVRLLVGDVRGKGLSAVRTATVVLGEFRAAAAGTADVAARGPRDRPADPAVPARRRGLRDRAAGRHRARRRLPRRLLRPSRAVLLPARGDVETVELDPPRRSVSASTR